MRIILSVLLLAHGVAHLPGFLVSWRLRAFPEMPFRTTIIGESIEVGESGIRMVGLAWLVLSIVFAVAAAGTLTRAPWWQSLAYVAIPLSAALCLVGWPDARLGLVANAVILLLIVVAVRGAPTGLVVVTDGSPAAAPCVQRSSRSAGKIRGVGLCEQGEVPNT